jgi:DNA-binding Xre family transcriptional regulator
MLKKDLQKKAGISSASITKLGKNENVNTDILEKICKALDCDISDIMEMTEELKK